MHYGRAMKLTNCLCQKFNTLCFLTLVFAARINPTWEIRFEFVDDIKCREAREENSATCKREREARTEKQKFKVISVKICSLRKGGTPSTI